MILLLDTRHQNHIRSMQSESIDRSEHQQHRGELPQDVGPLLQLQDLEHYLRRNGIETHQRDQPYQPLDQVELAANVASEDQYQKNIIQRFMEEENDQLANDEKEQLSQKRMILNGIAGKNISIKTADEVLTNVSLSPLAEQCDTLYTLVRTNHWSNKAMKDDPFVFSLLEQYPSKIVLKFLSIINQSSSVDDLSSDNIIECCELAHLLQCKLVLEEIVEIIKSSIDSENCTSICILADDLNIPSLLQASMGFILERLEDIKSDDEVWSEIPSSLRAHIITLRNAASSSIIGRGRKTSEVLFSSSNEFLAIFSDTLREHKDRLREAKQRQQEIIEEREKRNHNCPFFSRRDVFGGSVKDCEMKIEKQEKRVQTLEAFYREQKSIFAQNINSKFRGSFSL